jgi:hypothetical protein
MAMNLMDIIELVLAVGFVALVGWSAYLYLKSYAKYRTAAHPGLVSVDPRIWFAGASTARQWYAEEGFRMSRRSLLLIRIAVALLIVKLVVFGWNF